MEKEIIKRFAVDVLGCGCEQSVFESIDVDESFKLGCGVGLSKKILIGRRLLIYIVPAESCAPGDVGAVLREGLDERNRNGYNRLRLVVVAGDPDSMSGAYYDAFNICDERDEKTHIHILNVKDVV